MLNSFPYRRPLPTCVHTVRLSRCLRYVRACMCVFVFVCVQGNLTRSLKVSQQNQRRMAKAADDRKRRVCSASKTFHLTSIGWLAPGKIKPRSHPQAPHAHQGHPPVMLRVVRASRQTTSINIVLCAKKQPKLRHLSVLKVERVCSLIRLFVRSFAPQIEKWEKRKSEKWQKLVVGWQKREHAKQQKTAENLPRLATVSKDVPCLLVYDKDTNTSGRSSSRRCDSSIASHMPSQEQSVWWQCRAVPPGVTSLHYAQFVAFATFASLHAPLGLHSGKRRKSYHDPLTLNVWRRQRQRRRRLRGWRWSETTCLGFARHAACSNSGRNNKNNGRISRGAKAVGSRTMNHQWRQATSLIRCVLQWQRESFRQRAQHAVSRKLSAERERQRKRW